jgi:hypothetical protein
MVKMREYEIEVNTTSLFSHLDRLKEGGAEIIIYFPSMSSSFHDDGSYEKYTIIYNK